VYRGEEEDRGEAGAMESGIRILNPNALLHSYIPPRLPHREEEYEDLLKEYKIASYGLPPSHMIVLGPPGSGKTVTIRKALRDSGVPHVYLVSEPTAYGTLVALAGVLLGKRLWGLSFAPLWNSIERELPERCVLVLDEADRFMMNDKKSDLLLYYLSRRDGLSLTLVSNRANLVDYIKDARVKSSLKPKVKFFKPYGAEELEEIIRSRAREALGDDFEKFFELEAIRLMAALAAQRGGDARYSIDLLRESITSALYSGSDVVKVRHVEDARINIEKAEFESSMRSLSRTHKLMLLCALNSKKVGEAYSRFNALAPNYGLMPLSERRLREVFGDLELMGFISAERRGKEWVIIPSAWFDVVRAKEVLEKELTTFIR